MKTTTIILSFSTLLIISCNKDLEREEHRFKGKLVALDKGVETPVNNFELRLVETDVDKDFHTENGVDNEDGAVIAIEYTTSSGYFEFPKQNLRIQDGKYAYRQNFYIGSVSDFTNDEYSVFYLYDSNGERHELREVNLNDGGRIQAFNLKTVDYFDSKILQVKMGELNLLYDYTTPPDPNDTLFVQVYDPIENDYFQVAKVYSSIQTQPIQTKTHYATADSLQLILVKSNNGVRSTSDTTISLDYAEYKTVLIPFN
jgi:hypothetical protein